MFRDRRQTILGCCHHSFGGYDSYRGQRPPEDAQIGRGGFSNFFEIGEEFEQKVKRFNTTVKAFKVSFKNTDTNDDLSGTLRAALQESIGRGFRGGDPGPLVGLEISNSKEKPRMGPILIRFNTEERLTVDKGLNVVEKL
jgi:hypothetical protein